MRYRPPQKPELPLEMGDIQPQQDPKALVIGVCHRCQRQGLISKLERTCTGYRAVNAAGGLVQVPEARSVRCVSIALKKLSKSNRKLLSRVEKAPIRLPKRAA
jgi:hypothetical protein